MNKVTKLTMLATTTLASLAMLGTTLPSHPQLALQFGITHYAAQRIIDIIAVGGSIWGILAVVAGTAGWGAAVLAAGKYLISRYGVRAAAAW